MEKLTLGYMLKSVQYTLRQDLDSTLRQIGLTAPQYSVLRELELEPGSTNTALADACFVTPQTMIKILQKLEKAGYVLRESHPHHGRKIITNLTPAGRRQLANAQKRVEAIENLLTRGLTDSEQQVLNGLLMKCLVNLTDDHLEEL
jgi:DNA-binding MarR family transcriptional regulator